ncbi:hypothetical protein ACWDTT_10435 [Streptosporangium sandarakinum]
MPDLPETAGPSAEEQDRIDRIFRQWVTLKERIAADTTELGYLRDQLMEYAALYGEANAKGHRTSELTTEYTTTSGTTYAGWTREKRTTTRVNVDRVRALAEEKGLVDELFTTQTVEVLDQDKLYALQQEDRITTPELDELLDTTTTYALKGY